MVVAAPQSGWLRWLEDMAALARRYGCAGSKIWLRWLEDMTSLARRYDFVGLKRCIRSSNEALYLIECSG